MKTSPLFREDKATQVAARIIDREGGQIDILKLVKLVYLVDRAALISLGRPVTFDLFYNMVHGPVVSSTMDCINAVPEDETTPIWSRYIGPRQIHSVAVIRSPGTPDLSPAEEAIIDQVYGEVGSMSPFQLRDYTHDLPEYKDPTKHGEKRSPLRYRDVLRAVGWAEEDITDLIDDLRAELTAARVLG